MIIAFFLIIIILTTGFNFHSFLFPSTTQLHHYCLLKAPKGLWTQVYQGIVCGQNLPVGDLREALITTGLIHIIVVSGAHLIFLNKLLTNASSKYNLFKFIAPVLLLVYCGVCKVEPPVVRAFVSLLLILLNNKFKLFWPPLYRIHLSGLASLALFPEWIFSKSLILSWLAALAIHKSTSNLVSSSFCYVLLFPVLMSFSPLSPWTIIINSIFAPIAGYLLFPLSAFSFIVPPLSQLTDLLWKETSELIYFLQTLLPKTEKFQSLDFSIQAHWIYLFFVSWVFKTWKVKT